MLDNAGRLIAGIPLTYLEDGREWPIAARIVGNTATPFTPSVDPAHARPAAVLRPVDIESTGAVDPNTALSTAATQFGLATSVGTLLGSLIGGALGCVAGSVIGVPVGIASAIQFHNSVNGR